jgi:hypothetical protein
MHGSGPRPIQSNVHIIPDMGRVASPCLAPRPAILVCCPLSKVAGQQYFPDTFFSLPRYRFYSVVQPPPSPSNPSISPPPEPSPHLPPDPSPPCRQIRVHRRRSQIHIDRSRQIRVDLDRPVLLSRFTLNSEYVVLLVVLVWHAQLGRFKPKRIHGPSTVSGPSSAIQAVFSCQHPRGLPF